jgi:hypothetical protein
MEMGRGILIDQANVEPPITTGNGLKISNNPKGTLLERTKEIKIRA